MYSSTSQTRLTRPPVIIINVLKYEYIFLIYLSGFKQTWIISTNCNKVSKTKFYENPFSGGPTCSMRMGGDRERENGRYDEVKSRFSRLCDRA